MAICQVKDKLLGAQIVTNNHINEGIQIFKYLGNKYQIK
jgi:hypothetical protein